MVRALLDPQRQKETAMIPDYNFDVMSKRELVALARERKIKNYSHMLKSQLIAALIRDEERRRVES